MKKIFFLILMALPLVITSCKDDDDDKPEYNLDGVWISENTETTISGSSGRFSEITSGFWLNALENNFIEDNALRIKSIAKTGENEWSCSVLAVCHKLESTTATSVFWADDCTASLSNDNNTLTIEGLLSNSCNNPEEGTRLSKIVFTRKK